MHESSSPFHAGELAVQRRTGEADEGARNGRAISDRIVRGAFRFVAQQPFAVLATMPPTGGARATIVYGDPGFAEVEDERRLVLHLDRMHVEEGAAWLDDLLADPRLGTLFLEPSTRRRLRVNGAARRDGPRIELDVVESFPNCPKYIQSRAIVAPLEVGATPSEGEHLGAAEAALVRAADTFFIASSNPEGQLDASHRGGEPGFVEVLEEGARLRIPDYSGNHMYNTLGNVEVEPRVGLAFHDFETGRVLELRGRAHIVHDVDGSERRTGGTRRFWEFEVDGWISRDVPGAARWELIERSPFNPGSFG